MIGEWFWEESGGVVLIVRVGWEGIEIIEVVSWVFVFGIGV